MVLTRVTVAAKKKCWRIKLAKNCNLYTSIDFTKAAGQEAIKKGGGVSLKFWTVTIWIAQTFFFLGIMLLGFYCPIISFFIFVESKIKWKIFFGYSKFICIFVLKISIFLSDLKLFWRHLLSQYGTFSVHCSAYIFYRF